MNEMDTNRWSQVETIFNRACEISPEEQKEFVKNSCGGDKELETFILELLAADEIQTTELDAVPEFSSDISIEPETDAVQGNRIGPYRIIEELGRGGMGVVYLVERADKHFTKRMALKLVKRGMDTDEILHRFRHERQILASLEHPNIARLYDGGAAEDGRPYLVMEYVEGDPITTYCDTRHLSVNDRIRLFVTVCNGVQFAHQNFIVHRDLKPSNVMVTTDGDVRLLDFGIAKLLQSTPDDEIPVTRPLTRFVTSAFASPEQISGKRITTASDVYSLGIILYELLTGSHPYPQHMAEEDPGQHEPLQRAELPSKRVATTDTDEIFTQRNITKGSLQRLLKNDLDTILMTALEPDPRFRYQSAEQLLRDIERYINGYPVNAKPQPSIYKLRKFIRRNRIAAGFSFIILILTILFIVFTWVQHAEIVRERDTAEAVALFLEDLFEASDPYARSDQRLDTLRAFDLVERGRVKIGTLDLQPLVQARLADILGNVYRGVGVHDSAVVMHRKALEIRRKQPRSAWREKVATLNHLATDYLRYGRFDEVIPLLEEAISLIPSDEIMIRGGILQSLANVHRATGAFGPARTYLEESIQIQRTIDGTQGSSLDLASRLSDMALLLREIEEYRAAEPWAREALDIWEASGRDHPEKAALLNNFGSILHNLGKLDDAEVAFREAMAIETRILGADHPTLAMTLTQLAELAREKKDYATGIELYREALRRISSFDPENSGVAIVSGLLANVLRENGEYDEAEATYGRAIAHMKRIFPDTHVRIGRSYVGLGLNYQAQQKYREAEIALLEAERILNSSGNPGVERAYTALISLYEAWDKPEIANVYRSKLE
jgi:eukaryotic-like serine/threonine-protein kinase